MKHNVKIAIYVVMGCVGIFLLVMLFPGSSAEGNIPTQFKIGNEVVTLEIVDTPYARTIGLGGRTELGNREGMLFVFEHTDVYPFWMKDMLLPIDILWLNSGFEVVSLERNIPADSYPEIFTPDAKALYVLEIPAGVSKELGIAQGTQLEPIF